MISLLDIGNSKNISAICVHLFVVNKGNLKHYICLKKCISFFTALKMNYEIWFKYLVQVCLQIQAMNVINIDVEYQIV